MKLAHLPQAANLHYRRQPPQLLAIHTTSTGLARVAGAGAEPGTTRYDLAARDWYRRTGHPEYGAYLVGTTGEVYELAPPTKATWHVANLDARYRRDDWRRFGSPLDTTAWEAHGRDPDLVYDWWLERWPTAASPLDLAGDPHVNAVSIGIDLLPATDGTFAPSQLAAAAALVRQLCEQHAIPLERRRILGHEDLSPVTRGCVRRNGVIYGVPWCPGRRFDWSTFMQELQRCPAST